MSIGAGNMLSRASPSLSTCSTDNDDSDDDLASEWFLSPLIDFLFPFPFPFCFAGYPVLGDLSFDIRYDC